MADATKPETVVTVVAGELHRGLRWQHMPSSRDANKRMVFALFKRGEWPPRDWRVPAKLEGGDLMMLLHERACMNERKPKA